MKARICNSVFVGSFVVALLAVMCEPWVASAQEAPALPQAGEVVVHDTMRPVIAVTAYHPVVTATGTVVYKPVTVYSPATTPGAVVAYHPVVTTFSPVVTTSSPAVTTYRPVVVYDGSRVVVHPKVYVVGQPLRNLLRAITP